MRGAPVIIMVGLVLVAVIIGFAALQNSFAPLFSKLPLSQEINGKVLVAQGTATPGSVYELTWTTNGWGFKNKDAQLVDIITMNNVDLTVNDVVAPSLYVWYFDGSDDYLSFDSPFSPANITAAVVAAGFSLSAPDTSNSQVKWPDIVAMAPVFNVRVEWSDTDKYWYALASVFNSSTLAYAGVGMTSGVNPGVASSLVFSVYQNINGYWHKVSVVNGNVLEDADTAVSTSTYDIIKTGTTAPIVFPRETYRMGSTGTIDYVFMMWDSYYTSEEAQDFSKGLVKLKNTAFLADATFYNGSTYFDLINGVVGTPNGGVARVPSDNPHLWLVKSLTSDNKLHFKFFPPGTVIKIKDSSGNVIREYTIQGTANAADLVEDYAVDLGTVTLPQVNIEAVVPAHKVRVYGPSGFTLRLESGSFAQEYVIQDGYVDAVVPDNATSATIMLLADQEKTSGLDISVDDMGSYIRVRVINSTSKMAIPSAVVIAQSGSSFASATTDSDGYAVLNLDSDSATITVYYLDNGVVYKQTSSWIAPAPSTGTQAATGSGLMEKLKGVLPFTSNTTPIIAFLLALLAIIAVVALTRGGRRH